MHQGRLVANSHLHRPECQVYNDKGWAALPMGLPHCFRKVPNL